MIEPKNDLMIDSASDSMFDSLSVETSNEESPEMINLMILIPSMEGGGSERFTLHLLRQLPRNRYRITLLMVDRSGPLLSDIPSWIRTLGTAHSRVLKSLPALIGTIRRVKPDVVMSTLSHLNILMALARPLIPREIRVIARESNTISRNNANQPFPKLFDQLYRLFFSNLDGIICQSNDMFRDLMDNFHIPASKMKMIPNPVDNLTIAARADSMIRSGESPWPSSECIKLLACGRLHMEKGFDLLLRALALMNEKANHPDCSRYRSWSLRVIGHGPLRQELTDLTQELGLQNSVNFMGYVDDPIPWMAGADLFLLPSRFEGCPNALLENLAAGTPAVAFDCPGGINELITSPDIGFLAEKEDVNSLAASIFRAFEALENNSFSMKSIRSAVARHNMVRVINQYDDYISSMAVKHD